MPFFSSVIHILNRFSFIVNSIGVLLVTVAFVIFSFNVIRFLWLKKQGETADFEGLKRYILWSIVALTIMVAIWGIIIFLAANTGIGVGGCMHLPASIPGQPAPSLPAGCA